MTRPAWHGVRVGDEVRFKRERLWWRVTKVDRRRSVPTEFTLIHVEHPRGADVRKDRRYQAGWLTNIAERRRP